MTKLTNEQLRDTLWAADRQVPVDSVWQHKDGGRYVVIDHVFDTQRQGVSVVYRPVLVHDVKFSRPYEEWSVDRFARVD